tara:strand:+ start:269 stop:490 length:222 start_codon:yes stop_codon:yes gene_type:complete
MTSKQNRYIKMRMEQLKCDMEKAHDPHDKQWYNRLIQELDWALRIQIEDGSTHNCYMEMTRDEISEGDREIWR